MARFIRVYFDIQDMANWIRLYIGKKEVLSWPWFIPEPNKIVLRFIFRKEDFDVTPGDVGTCALKTTVSEVKKRLDRFRFSTGEIDRTITNLLEISLGEVEFALMDDDEFFDAHPEPDYDDEKKHDAWETLWNRKCELDYRRDKANLGNLAVFRYLRKILEDSDEGEIVQLAFEYSPEEVADETGLFLEGYDFVTELERKYLENAKVHLSTEDFDLVYIELIIALESATKKYIARKSRELLGRAEESIDLESITKDMSLINLVQFGIVFIGKTRLDKSVIESLRKAYNMRNNIVHNRARRFRVSDVAESIEVVEKIIKTIENLS